jgi:hypothetical protein
MIFMRFKLLQPFFWKKKHCAKLFVPRPFDPLKLTGGPATSANVLTRSAGSKTQPDLLLWRQ